MSEVPPRAGVVASLHAILAFEIRHSADERAFAWSLPLSRPLLYMLSIITAPGRALRAAEGARGPTTRPRAATRREAEPEGVPKAFKRPRPIFSLYRYKIVRHAQICIHMHSARLSSAEIQPSTTVLEDFISMAATIRVQLTTVNTQGTQTSVVVNLGLSDAYCTAPHVPH